MGVLSVSPRILKAGFVHFTSPAAVESTVVFQYNPETLSRRLSTAADATLALLPVPPEPQEVITFRIALDIDSSIGNAQSSSALGIYPQLSAIERLMYVPAISAKSLVLFIWGEDRVLPVRLMELQIVEQMFDATLTPTRAEIAVTLQVLKQADLAGQDWALRFWQEHLLKMQQLAASVPRVSLDRFGLKEL